MKVGEIMTTPVVTLPTTASIAEAAATMVRHRIGSIVVVDADDPSRVAGMFTEAELELAETPIPFSLPVARAPRLLDVWAQSPEQLDEALARVATRPLGEVMRPALHTTAPDAEVWEAMTRMAELELSRLPVVEEGRLVGLVARHDLLKAVVACAGEGPARADER